MADPISVIIKHEGGLVNNPIDGGGETFEGISKKSNPEAWAHGQPTDAQVRAVYEQKYLINTGISKVTNPQIQVQLLDWVVNSGPGVAISNLQIILGVPSDGILGSATLKALEGKDVNNQLVAARIKMIGRIVSKNPSQLTFLNGWLSRALEFLT